MASAPQLLNPSNNQLVIKKALEDFGVPAQKIFEIYNVYDSCIDFMLDGQKFKENYDKFNKIKNMANTVKDNAKAVSDKVNALNDEVLKKQSWNPMCKVDANKMNAAEITADEIKSNTDNLEKIFGTAESATKEADEILNRRNTLRFIQLALVFKDVVFGIHKVINTSRDIKYYNEQFTDILNKYVTPTIDSFTQHGTINDDLVERGIFMLKQLKHSLENKQYETQQSIITHGINTISTGLQAYATFQNISLFSGIASKSAIMLNYFIGGSQAALAVGSCLLTGIETYNYLQYKSLIGEIEEMITKLEEFQNYKSKSK